MSDDESSSDEETARFYERYWKRFERPSIFKKAPGIVRGLLLKRKKLSLKQMRQWWDRYKVKREEPEVTDKKVSKKSKAEAKKKGEKAEKKKTKGKEEEEKTTKKKTKEKKEAREEVKGKKVKVMEK